MRETGHEEGVVIDLDLVYEMFDPGRRPKTDAALWSAARRAAGRLAAGALGDGRPVVVEGDFAGDRALRELTDELPDSASVRLVLLEVDFPTAFRRASADPTRGASKDEAFLGAHYDAFEHGWNDLQVLRVDTGRFGVDESADRVLAWLAPTE
jgi:predicted kinase